MQVRNDAAELHGDPECAHVAFERHAAQAPEAPAVAFEGHTLGYRELDQRADRLARRLRRLGAGAGERIGICLERSLELPLVVLAILKSGAGYVPLDPSYPADRLRFIVDDVRPRAIVTRRSHLALVAACPSVLCLDDLEPALDAAGTDPAERLPRPSPRSVLCVIYTSGSTGRPKGVSVSHAAVHNTMRWHQRAVPRSARTLQFASLNFDASYYEILSCWSELGCLYIPPEGVRHDSEQLGGFLSEHRIERAMFPVVVLQQLAAVYADRPEALAALRVVGTIGEQLQITEPVRQLFRRLPDARLYNHYGPAETNTFVTVHQLPRRVDDWSSQPPIGTPIGGCQVRVLDAKLDPVGAEVEGEICISGASVSDGYFRRPELSAERFVPDPFGPSGERMYRTGDRARWLASGELQYLGRIDLQVKIRGNRVELGEIEAVLAQYPRLREVAVAARGTTAGERHLVAYLVARDGERLDPSQLFEFARRKLPAFMLPEALVVLPSLPVNANSKVDRRALPAPSEANTLRAPGEPPRDAREAAVHALWADALGTGRFGVTDNFFELGGNSLKAGVLIARLLTELGISLTLADLLAEPTIRGMLTHHALRSATPPAPQLAPPSPARGTLVALRSTGRLTPLFLAPAASGWAFPYAHLVRMLNPDRPIYAFQSPALFRDSPHDGIAAAARRFCAELRQRQPRGPYFLGGWCYGGLVAYEMANRLVADGDQVAALVLLDAPVPLRRHAILRARVQFMLARIALELVFRAPARLQSIVRPATGFLGDGPLWRFIAAYFVTNRPRDIARILTFCFPDRAHEIAGTTPAQQWDCVLRWVRDDPSLMNGVRIPGFDGDGARRALGVWADNEWDTNAYAPRWTYPGRIHLFAGRSSVFVGRTSDDMWRWQDFTQQPLDARQYDIRKIHVAAEFEFMEPDNVRLFAPDIDRLLDRLEPDPILPARARPEIV